MALKDTAFVHRMAEGGGDAFRLDDYSAKV
jgi:hypothetical protein